VKAITIRGVEQEPRLRFDKTAVGCIQRLQQALALSVPNGSTVVVLIAAPIRQDSKTSKSLEVLIGRLLASRRTRLATTILGNRIQVRVLRGGNARTERLIGFVHNPEPSPLVLFTVTGALLRSLGSGSSHSGGKRTLVIRNETGSAPLGTIRPVCLALRVRKVFRRILVSESGGERLL
jgi:hypothetical protein